ncbi:immediate early response gene 5-like protein [Sitophilus oryzae]|uniref:Immediate early response gene 5-like protein n=1 Tax=Sitophilus oryzae TaxID=7048 RepID=A0A6J2XL56_SITOR|nr:immediate early response gene 5-like protein [Sitophilus oryzae]
MASEAQRLIGISLTKIAQSRSHRGGVSLHKNLLVATVLQKARYIFMEEAYNMVHYHAPSPTIVQQLSIQQRPVQVEENLVGLTAEEAGLDSARPLNDFPTSSTNDDAQEPDCFETSCVKCTENQQDKENHPPFNSELTYLDLDKTSNILRERSNSSSSTSSLKRRRAVAEWETEEAVQSILPKKIRQDDEVSEVSDSDSSSSNDDSVFLDDAALLSDIVSKEVDEAERSQETSSSNNCGSGSAMEIDRITSLVSIFSFSMGGDGAAKLNRSMSTPDLCSAQAKDSADSLQQRPFLAMTV